LQRGWITIGDVETYYNVGVRVHMDQLGMVDAASTISITAADEYLTTNPFDASKA
jgi:hypothetical protein